MGTCHSIARARRAPLAACLSAALAFASTASAPAATPAEPFLHRRADGLALLFEKIKHRADAVQATRHGARRPEGGIVIPVTSCADDGGTDTLRHAVLVASSGDTVDLSGLACSTITLAAGAIGVDIDDLDIVGPGASHLTIDAGHTSRVFRHGGAGTLYIKDLTVANGSYTPVSGPYGGGCIYSAANISMADAVATGCSASGAGTIAGGAVLAIDSVILFGSAITESQLTSTSLGTSSVTAIGAGVFAGQQIVFEHSIVSGNSASAAEGNVYAGGVGALNVIAKYSTVHGNTATTVPGGMYYAIGGGMIATQNVLVEYSTFDGNTADGGGAILTRNSGYTVTFRNTTVSGNHANVIAGAMLVQSDITIQNSTIAFNTAGAEGGGGIMLEGTTADLESTIVADNSPSGMSAAADLDGSATVTGANNLVKISGLALPADTLTTDPQLGALAANGGETRTHALPATSVAIDAGNNEAGAFADQRGFARTVGAFPDIGAYELDTDVIFDDGFDAGG